MRFLIECDGAVLDAQQCYWDAYSTACEELGMPRTDPAGFWRAIRRGAGDQELVQAASGEKLRKFRVLFDSYVVSEKCVGKMNPQPNVKEALEVLRQSGECILIALPCNREVRQKLLDSFGLSEAFTRMKPLAEDRGRRVDQLRELAESDPQAIVAASTEALVIAGEDAGLFVAGIASGTCTRARLTRAGARVTFSDLADLAECLKRGCEELYDAGLPG